MEFRTKINKGDIVKNINKEFFRVFNEQVKYKVIGYDSNKKMYICKPIEKKHNLFTCDYKFNKKDLRVVIRK